MRLAVGFLAVIGGLIAAIIAVAAAIIIMEALREVWHRCANRRKWAKFYQRPNNKRLRK